MSDPNTNQSDDSSKAENAASSPDTSTDPTTPDLDEPVFPSNMLLKESCANEKDTPEDE